MDLWIRSQDKTKLMKANEIEICQNPTGTWWFNVGQCIGEYKTKERAIEVLNEINTFKDCIQFIEVLSNNKKCEYLKKIDFKNGDSLTYEMPKE